MLASRFKVVNMRRLLRDSDWFFKDWSEYFEAKKSKQKELAKGFYIIIISRLIQAEACNRCLTT